MFTIPGYNASGPDFEPFTIGDTSKQVIRPADIILTATALDSRVKYAGPSHYYLASDGLLKTSPANDWPLEYKNGVAVGRHEPEPASTNYQVRNRANAESGNVVKSSNLSLVSDPTGGPDGGPAPKLPLVVDSFLVSQDNGGNQLVTQALYSLSTDWKRMVFPVNNTQVSKIRTWLGRTSTTQDGSPFLYLTQGANLAIRNWVFSWFARKNADGTTFTPTFVQIEYGNGAFATSPIINESTETNTRSESSVSVLKDGDAKGISVYFTDGTNKDYDFGDSSSIMLDKVKSNWSSRYITKISYRI